MSTAEVAEYGVNAREQVYRSNTLQSETPPEREGGQHPAEKRKKNFITQKEINLPDAEALLKTLIPCTYAPPGRLRSQSPFTS